ncbi:MAG: hypothetical protein DMF24_00425 [Verrucomicrobia bacterium]|nr:MAG: hypothetical protein DME90_06795 [Verrucomicrobiota bacterium]PYL63444.1 MAG: hypothetical protein DMF24_00425 [Verrucomicrobiota bacterium]
MKTHILAFILSLTVCFGARADLKFDKTEIELHPTPADKQAIGHFTYLNTGKQPVHFKSVKASCGCTAAQSQKDEVKPGEKGEVTATFNIGDRTGTQVKTVTVETDDATNPHTVLTLRTIIPQQLEINPTFVFWKQGEKPDPKGITVKVGKEFTVKNIKVTSSTPDFQTKVQEAGKGEFKIDVQPKDTTSLIGTTLTIQPEDSSKVFYATARVTGAPPAPIAPADQKAPAGQAAPVAPTDQKPPVGKAAPAASGAPAGQTH